MLNFNQIKSSVHNEMIKFEDYFRANLKSPVPLLDIILNYIIRRKGKQLRPMFVFLSAKLHGNINESTYTAAALIELLHTATLIHDDVVDESYERRGFFSINALWKSKIAVLVGDFLLSKGLLLAIQNKEYQLLGIVSEAMREMSEGELLQIEKSRGLNITEELYFEIIEKKTATLIAACTASGAKSVNCNEDTINKMKLFGKMTGVAFQIKDDLLDYQKNGTIGKPTGNDIKEKKLTLPIIYTLNNSPGDVKRKILKTLKSPDKDSSKIKEVIDLVLKNGGIEYAAKKMNDYKLKAVRILYEFPSNEARDALENLVEFTTTRNK